MKEIDRKIREHSEDVYLKDNVILILGDNREVLKEFDDEVFDAIITDPPYGINAFEYDRESEVFFELEDEFYRVLKRDAWFVFWYAIKKLNEIGRIKKFQYKWLIVALFNGLVTKSFLGNRKYAPVCVFSKGDPKVGRRREDAILCIELPGSYETKIGVGDFKATFVQGELLDMFAKEGGIVLDPFAGFGSLLFAGLRCRRDLKIIGIEKDRARFEVAKRILEREKIEKPIPEMMREIENVVQEKWKTYYLFDAN